MLVRVSWAPVCPEPLWVPRLGCVRCCMPGAAGTGAVTGGVAAERGEEGCSARDLTAGKPSSQPHRSLGCPRTPLTNWERCLARAAFEALSKFFFYNGQKNSIARKCIKPLIGILIPKWQRVQ